MFLAVAKFAKRKRKKRWREPNFLLTQQNCTWIWHLECLVYSVACFSSSFYLVPCLVLCFALVWGACFVSLVRELGLLLSVNFLRFCKEVFFFQIWVKRKTFFCRSVLLFFLGEFFVNFFAAVSVSSSDGEAGLVGGDGGRRRWQRRECIDAEEVRSFRSY
jgi:hypothetical protein